MFCDNCGTQLNDGDLFCPNCGQKSDSAAMYQQTQPQYQQTPPHYQQPQQPYPYGQTGAALSEAAAKKKKTAIIIGASAGGVLLLALLIFLLLRFFGGDKETKPTKETTRRITDTSETQEVFTKLGLGESGEFENLTVAIDKVTRPNAEFLYSKPEDGNEHVLIWFNFENRTDKPQKTPVRSKIYLVYGEDPDSDSGYDMISYDAEAEYFTTEGEFEPAKELAPGEKSNGWLLYQKPVSLNVITIHMYSEFVNKAPDLAFSFPIALEEVVETDTTETTAPTTSETTAPIDIDLNNLLPGVWASLPSSENYSFVYGFDEAGRVGSSFAYNSGTEQNLDNWDVPGVWSIDPYTWSDWRLERGDLIITDPMGDIRISLKVINNDEIQLISEQNAEPLTLFRKGVSPDLYDYLIGTWVPDVPDAGGVYAALSFYIDGTAALTGANKAVETATAENWGYEEYWSVLGVVDGVWRLEGENIIIAMQDSEDVYTVTINSANKCTIFYGDSWQTPYTRVAFSY